jgi:hypothetical protein
MTDTKITSNKTLMKLKKLTSSYSFGRVLCLISYVENTSASAMLNQNFKSQRERLINTEIAFLAALWLENYRNEKSIQWNENDDNRKMLEVYRYMDIYHKSLKSHELGKSIREVGVYEGDGGYDWQFIELTIPRYECIRKDLQDYYNIDISAFPSFYKKLYKHINKRLQILGSGKIEKNLRNAVNTFKIYQLSKKEFEEIFDIKELIIARKFISKLGNYDGNTINDIFEFNKFNACPIIELPNGNILIINFYILAKAIYESPYYWICDLPKKTSQRLLAKMGYGSEFAAQKILKKLQFTTIYPNVKIKRTKKEDKTDIDALLIYNDEAVVFQIKSQKFTAKSRAGDVKSIEDNFNKAIIKAYSQGIESVESCLKIKKHKELQNIGELDKIKKFHLICLTSDYYPTLTPTCYLKQREIANNIYPLIGMTFLDLSTICYLLDADTFIKYVYFREKCAEEEIYADNEMYILGKFIQSIIEEPLPLVTRQKLSSEYAMLVDAIITPIHFIGITNDGLHNFLKIFENIFDKSKPIEFSNQSMEYYVKVLRHLHQTPIIVYKPNETK